MGRQGKEGKLPEAFEEADIRVGLKEGGQILGALIVARSAEEFAVYLRASWGRGRGFRIIRTWRGASGDRTFKRLDSAWSFIRKFGYSGHVTIYPTGDSSLSQFVGIVAADTAPLGQAEWAGSPEVTAPGSEA